MFCRDYNANVVKINRAVAGSHIMNDYADNLTTQVAAATSDNAHLAFVMLGTNDNNLGDMEAMQTLLETQLAILQSDHPSARIYYINVLPRWTDVTGVTEEPKDNIRAAVVAACATLGITVWDTYTTPWIAANQTTDGLHPNAAGNSAISAEVLARL